MTTIASNSTSLTVIAQQTQTGNVTIVTTPVAYGTIINDVGSTINLKNSLGVSKHLDGVVYNGRWYKVFGDHQQIDQNAPAIQSGNQNYVSLNLTDNTWRKEKNYFTRFAPSPDSKIEQALPDDGGVALRGNEIWTFWSVRDNDATTTTAQQTASVRASFGSDIVQQQLEAITAWNIDTGAFRIAAPSRPFEMGGDRQWRTYYDNVLDVFFTPCTVGGETVWILFNGATGADITWRNAGVAQTWSAGGFVKDIRIAGMAVDPLTRNVYTYDHHTNFLWRWNLDTIFNRGWGQEVNVLTVPNEFNASDQSAYKLLWHPVLRAVYMSFNWMHVYQVDTAAMTSIQHTDGYTPSDVGSLISPSTIFYDAINNDVVGIGGGGAVSAIPSTFFWRNHITASSVPSWVPALNTVGPIALNTMDAVNPCPQGGCAYAGQGFHNITDAWNGGGFSPDYGTLGAYFVCGGGDTDGFDNSIYVFPLDTRIWIRIGGPSLRAGTPFIGTANFGTGEWDDGTPGMPHTYDGVQYLPPSMGGGPKGSALLPVKAFWYAQNTTGWAHRCDLATGVWSRASTGSFGSVQDSTWCFDSDRSRFLGCLTGPSAPITPLRAFDNFTNGVGVHEAQISISDTRLARDAISEYIPSRQAWVMFGTTDANVPTIHAYDVGAGAFNTKITLNISGSLPFILTGPGMCWCSDLDCLFIRDPSPGSEQKLWKVQAPSTNWQTNPWVVTQITMAGVGVGGSTTNGMWKRLRYAPLIKSVMWLTTTSANVYAYRVA